MKLGYARVSTEDQTMQLQRPRSKELLRKSVRG
jgi:DNA invertase Pin-like site-specific DNA recombinase